MIKLKTIKPNPDNPRVIKDGKFIKLTESIRKFPRMMELRPIIIDEKRVILGGNMRFRVLSELGYEEVPDNWILKAGDLTADQKREFIVKDNVGFGEWDWETLANEWDADQLEDWGVDLPVLKIEKTEDEPQGYVDMPAWFLNIRCNDEAECQRLYEKFIAEGLDVKIVT